jgi:hypothetical protein
VASRDSLRTPLLQAMVGHAQLDANTVAIATKLDARSPELHSAVAQLLAGESALGAGTFALARAAVLDPKLDPRIRGSLLTAIAQAPGNDALDVAAEVFSRLNPGASIAAAGAPVVVTGSPATTPGATPAAAMPAAATPTAATAPTATAGTPTAGADPVEAAWRRFVGDRRRMGEIDYFITMAKKTEPSQRTLAYAVLLQSVRSPRTPAPVREKVTPVLDAAWTDPAAAASLAQAIGVMHLENQYTDKLAAYNQTKSKSK